jgi:hypothetical protein
MASITDFERAVHNCTLCKERGLERIVHHYPVLSFGDTIDKPLLVVGLNPSTVEFEDGYLSNSIKVEERHQSQMEYFKNDYYGFFFNKLEPFFNGKAKIALKWVDSPWEKVAFVDLAKCPTRNDKGQWTQLKPNQKKQITSFCEGYLITQLNEINPQAVIAYGADVCRWFYPDYDYKKAYSRIETTKNGKVFNVIFVPQSQGGHPHQIIQIIQNKIFQIFSD